MTERKTPSAKGGPRPGPGGASQRMLRVGEQVRHGLVAILQRADIDDPLLVTSLVSVTEVRMSPDLKIANAYVTAMGGPATDAVVKALARHAKYLRGRLAPELRQMKFMPELRFRADTSFETFAKIDRLLHSEVVRRDVAGGSDEEAGGGDAGAEDGAGGARPAR